MWSRRSFTSLLILTGHLVLVSIVSAQAASLQDARAKMQAGDFAGAAVILEDVVAAEPDNAQAWLSLATARERSNQHDSAIEAYHHAIGFTTTNGRALYGLGLMYASDGEIDSAFGYLTQAHHTATINMTRIGIDPRSTSLREDPRYGTLFPTETELAHPFLEDVTILRQWSGEAAGDQFGWIARNIGDVDGDGINDVTTSAPTKNAEGPGAGRVYVYSSATGALRWAHTGAPGSQLGIGIEAAGDVNADGIPDVIAGAPGESKAYVFSGNDGRILYTLAEPDSASGFGSNVADLGDVDDDGHDDVLVGAPGAQEGTGAAYVYSGRDGSLLFTFSGERAGDAFGSAAGGWYDGSRGIIAIGAPNAGPTNGGRVYVYRSLDHEPAFVMEADEDSQQLGAMFVSVVGDVDADGTPDVYASDWAHGALGAFTGRIFVNSGATGEQLMVKTGEAAGDGFGIGVADAGDLNHDGHDDLIVGAWQHAGHAPSGGKSYLYSGKDGSLMQTYTGIVPGETFGFDATGMGDVNGDGIADLLITSARSAIHGTWTGRMFIIKGT
jgi:tetratricopeptide (TPR) repeat protein